MSGGLKEGAIRLFEATHELGIAEGIETCLAVRQRNGQPVWAAVNCHNLEVIAVPDSVKSVHIYADNDADSYFDGQASAFILARRLVNEAARKHLDRKVNVFVPQHDGQTGAMWSPHTPGSLVRPRALQSVSLAGGAPFSVGPRRGPSEMALPNGELQAVGRRT